MRLLPRALLALSFLAIAPAVAGDLPEVSAALEDSSGFGPAEKLAFADAATAEIVLAVGEVQELLAKAEKQDDAEAVECVNRKLLPLKALQGVANTSAAALRAAVNGGDTPHADQEFRKVAVALTKARELLAEARTCLGDDSGKAGSAAVSVDEGDLGVEPPLENEGPVDVVPGSAN